MSPPATPQSCGNSALFSTTKFLFPLGALSLRTGGLPGGNATAGIEYIYIYICTYLRICVHMHMCLYICVCVYVCISAETGLLTCVLYIYAFNVSQKRSSFVFCLGCKENCNNGVLSYSYCGNFSNG